VLPLREVFSLKGGHPEMTKSGSAKAYPLLGVVFMIAGALTLILAFLNYLQDERINLTIVLGFISILLGLFWYSHAKKREAPDE
jgi:uncharacterized membrane protein HdeD (DUF308 family)